MGKSSTNGTCSIAMLVYQRVIAMLQKKNGVALASDALPKINHL
jgi:hypothetical protein